MLLAARTLGSFGAIQALTHDRSEKIFNNNGLRMPALDIGNRSALCSQRLRPHLRQSALMEVRRLRDPACEIPEYEVRQRHDPPRVLVEAGNRVKFLAS